MSSLKSDRTKKQLIISIVLQSVYESQVFIALIMATVDKSALDLDEMISDTFIMLSFLQSIHYHYRQPVCFIKSALKSIKPHWTSWEEKKSKWSAFICGKELSAYLDKWLCSSQ